MVVIFENNKDVMDLTIVKNAIESMLLKGIHYSTKLMPSVVFLPKNW
jgi:hypothetical protein